MEGQLALLFSFEQRRVVGELISATFLGGGAASLDTLTDILGCKYRI